MKKNTLSSKIISRLLPAILLLVISIFIIYYIFARHSIAEHTAENARITAENTVHRIEEIIKQAQMIPRNLSWMTESGSLDKDSIYPFLKRLVENNPLIYASAIAFEPGLGQKGEQFYSPYAYRSGDSVYTKNLGSESYNYHIMDWYQIPFMLQKPYWTEPYFDEGGADALLSTFSFPFFIHQDGEKIPGGIITIDISLDWLTDIVNSVKILDSGYAFLISGNGIYVTHPDKSNIMNHSIFTKAKEFGMAQMREIGKQMIKGENGYSSITIPSTGKVMLYFQQLPSPGWSLGVVYPHDEMYASLSKLNILIVILSLLAIILLIIFTFKIINKQLKPLTSFAESARSIAGGNFSVILPEINSKDEMKELRDSFDFMQKELAGYIENLRLTTSAKEKIESELRIAKEIQMGMIPNIFPPFPQIKEIDLFATLESAKEVGGDLYDFFMIDNTQLCFAIGDVSGKGVPASLFMAVTRTLLRSLAQPDKSTSCTVSEINATLCLNNDSNMFVTFFMGILDTTNGTLRYCNAGHNPPVIIKYNEPSSENNHTTSQDKESNLQNEEPTSRNKTSISYFEITKGIPLGLFEEFSFIEETTRLNPGDQLFLYTDGLTEAENHTKELYSETHLLQTIQTLHNTNNNQDTQNDDSNSAERTQLISPRTLIEEIIKSVKQHVNGNEQSDDLTMLSIQYRGKLSENKRDVIKSQIEIHNDISEIPVINNWIENTVENWQLNPALNQTLQLILEECFTNTVFYAYEPGAKEKIQITFTLHKTDHDQETNQSSQQETHPAQQKTHPAQQNQSGMSNNTLIIEIKDNGKYFDPTKSDDPDTTLTAQERQIGGLGIFLVKQMTDNITYKRLHGHNILTIQKNLT